MSYEQKGLGREELPPGAYTGPAISWMPSGWQGESAQNVNEDRLRRLREVTAQARCVEAPNGFRRWVGLSIAEGQRQRGCVPTGNRRTVGGCTPGQIATSERFPEMSIHCAPAQQQEEWCCPGAATTPLSTPPLMVGSRSGAWLRQQREEYLRRRRQAQECQATGGRVQTFTGQRMSERLECPAGSLLLESFNAAGPNVRTYIPGMRCCFPTAATAASATSATGPWYLHPAILVGGGIAAALVAMKLAGRKTSELETAKATR